MKVFVADEAKVENYLLPEKIEDTFLINYESKDGILENIIISANNGKWMIKETRDFIIRKGLSSIASDELKHLNFYDIKFGDIDEKIKIYCFDVPMKYKSYSIANLSKITLGKSNNDIIYNSVDVGVLHFTIEKKENVWFFKSEGNGITYINGNRATSRSLIRGDVLFIDGLKIIWMDTFLLMNDLGDFVQVHLSNYQKLNTFGQGNAYNPIVGSEKYATLYSDNQVFFHTPRLKATFDGIEVEIDIPPEPIKDDGPPAMLTLGATVMMGVSSSVTGLVALFSVMSGQSTVIGAITELTLCVSMVAGCICFPIMLDKYQKKKIKSKEKKRQEKYLAYLQSKRLLINEAMEKEKSILIQNNLSPSELVESIKNRTNKIWSREINDNDFLTIRLGLGNRKANVSVHSMIEDFNLEDDNLRDEVKKLMNEKFILHDVPINISLTEDKILPIIISEDCEKKEQIIYNLLLQFITLYSGIDLKIIILTEETKIQQWEYIKYLPHSRSVDNTTRFFASNELEMKQVSSYLEGIYNERLSKIKYNEQENNFEEQKDTTYKKFDEYYLIITDNYIQAKNFGIIDKLLNDKANFGFSLMMIEPTLKNIPSRFNKFIQYTLNSAGIYEKDLSHEQRNFTPDYFEGDISNCSLVIGNIPVSSTSMMNQLPTTLQFLEMYNVGKVDQLNILNRWEKNDPTISLSAPVGVHPDGKLFDLDLHEKYHGPHGLIAGSTGSGKSEFIITYILSMAVNYHPDEVQFVLIDYKGGGLAGAFENRETQVKIPHLVGTITNLDTGEMNRTLVSINSELKRRQRMFNEARDALGESTVDIYKYQKFYRNGKVKEPISHLFIISDEFAELKSQQPDFMAELISTARIGRSLGVHLILATQKPTGVVDDQIWSNSKFKVCLKVQTSEDSMELLKRDDAASLKETGRFYLQVGYNELFELGQSAWSGAKYIPQDRVEKTVDDNIYFIDNNGNLIHQVNDLVKVANTVNYGDQLTNIVKNLYDIAKRESISFRQLWLPNIPKEIYLSNTIKKYNYQAKPYSINPVIGEYDLPTEQLQKLLTMDFTNNGNLIIYGTPGSGKENLLMTTLYSICAYHTTDEVNIYIMDFGSEILKIFNSAPQVGDVVFAEDKNKVKSLFLMLEREINRRKDLFSSHGGSYASYIESDKEKLPLLLIILNGYESFIENYGSYDDFLAHIIRESAKYGIVFMMTAFGPASVISKINQAFPNKIAMQLADSFDYQFYLNAPHGLTPSKYYGRGIVSVDKTAYEFQTCYIYLKEQINQIIKTSFEKLNYTKAKAIPVIPETVTVDSLSAHIDNYTNIPIGVNIYDASICQFNIIQNPISQIIGNNLLVENDFINHFLSILSSVPNIKMEIIDFMGNIGINSGISYTNNNFTEKLKSITDGDGNGNKKVYILIGIGYIYDKVLDEGVNHLFSIFNHLDDYPNSYFVFADNYSSYKRIMKEEWYSKSVNNKSGIWIGKGIDSQKAMEISNLATSDVNEDFQGLSYVINNEKYQVMKCIGTIERSDTY
ncbi:MAG: type VII secretion protein EssC [Bacilli bacterium]|nr:type VII secretion protein EssC [Bacilli bacterium]